MRRRPSRLSIIVVLISAMILTLMGRLYYVQLLDGDKPVQMAGQLHTGSIVIPAARGQIVDAAGRALVDNVSVQTITVDRQTLLAQPDHGASVLARLGRLLGTDSATLGREITPCSQTVSAPCWTGQPYEPVPVAADARTEAVLAISEHREQFPGVSVQATTQTHYPHGSLAAHVLGYTTQVSEQDKAADRTLNDADQIGSSGLEAQYDAVLRGIDGTQRVQLNPQGYAVGDGELTAPIQGSTLVTSLDLGIQQLAEQSLAQQIKDSRAQGYAATSGAVVVMDPNTGRLVAAASYPTYNPEAFVGGISQADYAKLTAPEADDPLVGRAIAGHYAPGSTFKLISTASLVSHGEVSLDGSFACPGSVQIDGRTKTNFESQGYPGTMPLSDILGHSCDTFYYTAAANEYYADEQRIDAGGKASEWLQETAAAFGVGSAPGIDLPASEQTSGSFADRESRKTRWEANKADYCAEAAKGYPDVTPLSRRQYLTKLASENCSDGWRYRAGDNADLAIGQGETTMSPLQLAVAYSALVNGGAVYEPSIGWAVVDGNGKVAQQITPKLRTKLDVNRSTFDYIADSLNFGRGWAVSGAYAWIGSPYQSLLGGKTGTAEVEGQQDTSWIATWGPTARDASGHTSAKFVVVGMVEQAGTGAKAAGPMLKRVWDGIMGAGSVPVVPDSAPRTSLPRIATQQTVTR